MKKEYPILDAGGIVPPQLEAPAPHGAALFYTARWHVWRINGVPMLFERRAVKARRTEKDRPHIVHHDTVPVVPHTMARECGIDLGVLADARAAVAEHVRGLT